MKGSYNGVWGANNRGCGLISEGLISEWLISEGLISEGLISEGLISGGTYNRDFTVAISLY